MDVEAFELPQREAMEFDVVIVALVRPVFSAAIRLKQLAAENRPRRLCGRAEKGSEVGAHILSGAVIDPVASTASSPIGKPRVHPSKRK